MDAAQLWCSQADRGLCPSATTSCHTYNYSFCYPAMWNEGPLHCFWHMGSASRGKSAAWWYATSPALIYGGQPSDFDTHTCARSQAHIEITGILRRKFVEKRQSNRLQGCNFQPTLRRPENWSFLALPLFSWGVQLPRLAAGESTCYRTLPDPRHIFCCFPISDSVPLTNPLCFRNIT